MYEKRSLSNDLKQLVKQRDNFRCVIDSCKSHAEPQPELNIHHVLPEKFGGSDDPSNLVTLCLPHHKMVHIDFHAYYPDSRRAVVKMWLHLKGLQSKMSSVVQFGRFIDYKAPLEYLTGHRSFRGGQDEAFRAVMNKRDVLFVAPTGVGKSVTYQLPGLLYKKPTLVISPLKSLMKDQVQSLWRRYIPSTFLNGDLSEQDSQNRIRMVQENLMKFVYVAPERFFKSPKSKPLFVRDRYDLLVIDEAHCIDKWGGHFRPSYGDLGMLRSALGSPQTIAVTASASRDTQNEIIRSLGLKNPVRIVKGFRRTNIQIRTLLEFGDKTKQLETLLSKGMPRRGKALFYVASVKEGVRLQELMLRCGLEVPFYHGKMNVEEKIQIQDRFSGIRHNDEINIVIATSAFGMGIDIPNIRLVVHWNVPGNIEDYYQQIGRAGRDRKISHAVILYDNRDEELPRWIAMQSVLSSEELTDEEKDAAKKRVYTETSTMRALVYSENPWAYILQYFGDTAYASKGASVWVYVERFTSWLSRSLR